MRKPAFRCYSKCTNIHLQSTKLFKLRASHNTQLLLLYWRTQRAIPAWWTQSHRCPTARAQASLMLSIPDYPPSRQGKSLDYVLACVVDKIMKKRRKTNRTLLATFYIATMSRTNPTSQPELTKYPQMALIFVSCKMPEFFENSCLQNVSTDVKFDEWWKY